MKAAINGAASSITATTEEKRRHAQRVILKSIEAAFGKRDIDIASSMMEAAYKLYAEAYPGTGTERETLLIKDNYPQATEQSIKERAIADPGAYLFMHSIYTLTAIALDYNATSNWGADLRNDSKLNAKVSDDLCRSLDDVFARAVNSGLSPVGAAALGVTASIRFANGRNVEFLKIMRMLMNGLEYAFSDEIDPLTLAADKVRH